MRRRVLLGALAVVFIGLTTYGLNKLEPAAREVDRSSVWFGVVERGEMLRAVRGPGTLVPEEIRWVTAEQNGQVEQVHIQAGAVVKSDTVILELSNPELEQAVEETHLQLLGTLSEYADLEVRLDSQLLNQEAELARAKADYEGALLEAEANQELSDAGVISSIVLRRSQLTAEQMTVRYQNEQKRLLKTAESNRSQLAVKQSEVDQRRATYDLRQRQYDSLRVRAGIDGVLQEVMIEVGERVTAGIRLARVANPLTLKAELRINETQAKDVAVGQVANIDTRNGKVKGRVVRIDPAVQQGTVLVDVAIDDDLPPGARPDLSVDGQVEIERLEDVLYVNRPTYVQPDSTVGLFKLMEDGSTARRVQVRLGKISVQTVEIVEGLAVGEQVILSDTSAYDDVDVIRLN